VAPSNNRSTSPDPALDALFAGKEPNVRETYDRLIELLQRLGPVHVEPKKTSIHLVNRTGFAGVHTRKSAMILEIKSERAIDSPRVEKSDRVSANRFHNAVRLSSSDEVDDELLEWLAEGYRLSG
jgi:hypothetical protein